tara:strand:- start:6507 stop:7349 length:843 start_codon:yes stop_codon:yes gene_type:complete
MTRSVASITETDEPRLLLIDDEPAILASFALAFGDQGWAVTTAESGEDGLALYELGAFELVITDKNLPGMSGVEVVSEIRKLDAVVTIMMLTGFGTISSAADTLNAGVDAYVEKPVRDVIRLTARAKAIISRREKQRERIRAARSSPPNPFEVLVLTGNQASAKLISGDLDGKVDRISVAANLEELQAAVRNRVFGLILVEDEIANLRDTIEATKKESGTPIAVLGQHLGLDTIMSLVETGIAACVVFPVGSPQCAERLGELVKRFRVDTDAQQTANQSG